MNQDRDIINSDNNVCIQCGDFTQDEVCERCQHQADIELALAKRQFEFNSIGRDAQWQL